MASGQTGTVAGIGPFLPPAFSLQEEMDQGLDGTRKQPTSGRLRADFDGRLVVAKNDGIPQRLPVRNEEIAEQPPDLIP